MFIYCFLIVLFIELTVSKTNEALYLKTLEKDCHRCKVLTDSFDHWLDKTSRGKFEGGDAAWEESKLKSYARSEIRLVEIQEGLCSEVKKSQNQCYTLNEEVEQLIESWWALENSTSIDLYTWLCIDNLKYCCPKNHYGENCQMCPLKNNIMCNDHGKCNGEGTRQGNGSCICSDGYNGVNCEECDDNYFSVGNTCERCHKSCRRCHNYGPFACVECAVGWVLELSECVDINECHSSSVCKRNQFCINNEGSYSCKACHRSCDTCTGSGSFNCSSCIPNQVLIDSQCITAEVLQQTLKSVILRIILYLILIIINIIIFKKSRSLAALVVLGLSIVIFYIEKNYEISIKHLVLNYSNVLESFT